MCPTCLHEITNNDRDHVEKEKNIILKDIKNCEEDIESLNQQIINIKELKQNNINARDQINQYISNIKTVNNNNKLTKTYIQNLDKDLQKNNNDLKDLQKKETSIEIQDLDNKINNNLKEVKQLEQDSNTIYKNLSTLEIVKYILSEEGVKSFIVNKILDVLNNRLLYYLQKNDANCICKFN